MTVEKPERDERRTAQQATKERASKVSIASVSLLLAIKAGAAAATGSIGILADAVHSLLDLAGTIIGYWGVRVSAKPPDEKHLFGHGRAEDIAGASISTLIFIAGGIIGYQSIQRLSTGADVHMVEAGIAATVAAIAINVAASRYVFRVARRSDSVALEATGRDLMADVLSSIAVLAGLLLVRATGKATLDPIVALVVVVLIFRAAWITMRKATTALMDTSLPEGEIQAIRAVLSTHKKIANYHGLRTRKAGSQRHVVAHIVVARDYTVEEGHRIAEEIEDEIRAMYEETVITVHVEPCTPDCAECPSPCDQRKQDSTGAHGPIEPH